MQVYVTVSALEELKAVTDLLQEQLSQWPASKEKQMDIRLCLMEAVQNGLLYGKPEDGGKAEVHVSWKCSEDGFVFSVEDHGPGIPAELREEGRDILSFEEHGRGILLMQTILDELTFNEKGNRLTGSVRWQPGGGTES